MGFLFSKPERSDGGLTYRSSTAYKQTNVNRAPANRAPANRARANKERANKERALAAAAAAAPGAGFINIPPPAPQPAPPRVRGRSRTPSNGSSTNISNRMEQETKADSVTDEEAGNRESKGVEDVPSPVAGTGDRRNGSRPPSNRQGRGRGGPTSRNRLAIATAAGRGSMPPQRMPGPRSASTIGRGPPRATSPRKRRVPSRRQDSGDNGDNSYVKLGPQNGMLRTVTDPSVWNNESSMTHRKAKAIGLQTGTIRRGAIRAANSRGAAVANEVNNRNLTPHEAAKRARENIRRRGAVTNTTGRPGQPNRPNRPNRRSVLTVGNDDASAASNKAESNRKERIKEHKRQVLKQYRTKIAGLKKSEREITGKNTWSLKRRERLIRERRNTARRYKGYEKNIPNAKKNFDNAYRNLTEIKKQIYEQNDENRKRYRRPMRSTMTL